MPESEVYDCPRLQHDAAVAAATADVGVVASLLREEEKRDAFEEFYRITLAAIQAYAQQRNRELLRLQPGRNSLMFAQTSSDDTVISLLVWAGIIAVVYYRRKWRPSGTAFGIARWCSVKDLKKAGMLAGRGLVLGRTLKSGELIQLPNYTHTLLVGPTGGGKGVSIIIPNALKYSAGSMVLFDCKGDLFDTTAEHRQRMTNRIIRLSPFNGGSDGFNVLDTIPINSPMLVDSARALACAIVVNAEQSSADPHWNDRATMVITAIIVFVLVSLRGAQRNLNSVQDIASDPEMVRAVAEKLRAMSGVRERLGNQLKILFDKDGALSKEGAGVFSTVSRHLAFLDSELVARAISHSTFDISELLKGGLTVYLQIPPDQLEAQKGLLRLWISTWIREIGVSGGEHRGEVLFLLDEASALGNLPALEEALVRGRSAGVRLLLAYQSDAQVRAAFKDKETLLYDNCATQVWLAPTSIETADRMSKSIGDYTQIVDSYGTNYSLSWQDVSQNGNNYSRGNNMNYAQQGRNLIRPEELLTMNDDNLIVFQRGLSPLIARRVLWYSENWFNPNLPKLQWRTMPWKWWAVAVIALYIIVMLLRRK